MRSLLAAILSFFLPPRGAHRVGAVPPRPSRPPVPAYAPARRPRPCATGVSATGGSLRVRPYVLLWEHERDERERRRVQRERRRAAVLATLGQDYVPREAAA
jgi:hypothetical protein